MGWCTKAVLYKQPVTDDECQACAKPTHLLILSRSNLFTYDYSFFIFFSLLPMARIWAFISFPNSSFVAFLSILRACRSVFTAAFLAFLSSLDSSRGRVIVCRGAEVNRILSDRISVGGLLKPTGICVRRRITLISYGRRFPRTLFGMVGDGRKTCLWIKQYPCYSFAFISTYYTGVVFQVRISR